MEIKIGMQNLSWKIRWCCEYFLHVEKMWLCSDESDIIFNNVYYFWTRENLFYLLKIDIESIIDENNSSIGNNISNRIDSFNVRYQIEIIRELSLVSILESITHNYNCVYSNLGLCSKIRYLLMQENSMYLLFINLF